MGMKPGKFLFFDFLAALIAVPLLLCLGYFFGEHIALLTNVFTRIDSLLRMGAVLGGLIVLGYFIWKRTKSTALK